MFEESSLGSIVLTESLSRLQEISTAQRGRGAWKGKDAGRNREENIKGSEVYPSGLTRMRGQRKEASRGKKEEGVGVEVPQANGDQRRGKHRL